MRAFSDALRYEPAELPDVHVTTMLRAEEALGYPAMSTIPTTGEPDLNLRPSGPCASFPVPLA